MDCINYCIICWNVLITGYAQRGEVKEVFACFDKMLAAGLIVPNMVTFMILLSACSHDGLVDKGRKYFDSMTREHGIIPILEHYNCMVDLLGRAGQLEAISEMLNTMQVEPDDVTWNTLLGACRRWGNVKAAVSIFYHILQLDASCSAAYILLADVFGAAGMEEDAKKVESMRLHASECLYVG